MDTLINIHIVKNISELPDDLKPKDVFIIVTKFKFIYASLDRINTRTIIISKNSYDVDLSIESITKFIEEKKLKHAVIVNDTDYANIDINSVLSKFPPYKLFDIHRLHA